MPASLKIARLPGDRYGLVAPHEGLTELIGAATTLVARAFKSTVGDGLKLVRDMPKRENMVSGRPPARHVGRRHCMFAIGAGSRLVAIGAGSDDEVGEGAKEEVGVYAARYRAS